MDFKTGLFFIILLSSNCLMIKNNHKSVSIDKIIDDKVHNRVDHSIIYSKELNKLF